MTAAWLDSSVKTHHSLRKKGQWVRAGRLTFGQIRLVTVTGNKSGCRGRVKTRQLAVHDDLPWQPKFLCKNLATVITKTLKKTPKKQKTKHYWQACVAPMEFF